MGSGSAGADQVDVSVVIPTYNRPADLRECLRSILDQIARPGEVLVVDNSDAAAAETRRVVEEVAPDFSTAGITLQYVDNRHSNSLTSAKNAGIDRARGEIVSFLDDDVMLDRRYYEVMLEAFRTHPDALGVEGAVIDGRAKPPMRFELEQLLGRIFYLGFREAARCRVLPSLAVTYPLTDAVVTCEWLSGAAAYRRRIFEEFRPDEKLRKYADNEDLDLSYRIFRKYPRALLFVGRAKYHHKGSAAGRVTGRDRVYMQEVYRLYLFFKHIDVSVGTILIYLWSRLGRLIYLLGRSAARQSAADLREAGYLPGAWIICLRHLPEIRAGDLKFFDRFLA
jgi:GT2 family glycosyltransferase